MHSLLKEVLVQSEDRIEEIELDDEIDIEESEDDELYDIYVYDRNSHEFSTNNTCSETELLSMNLFDLYYIGEEPDYEDVPIAILTYEKGDGYIDIHLD